MTDLTLFDYTSLDSDTARLAKESAIEIKARERAIWENIIAIGNKLIEVKTALPHGQFMLWVSKEFGWSQSLANKYIKIAQEIKPNSYDNTNLPNTMSALYQLAAGLSKVDEETKQEILEEVQTKTEAKKEPLTENEIKEITKEFELKIKKLEGSKQQLTLEVENLKQEKNDLNEELKEAINQSLKYENEVNSLKLDIKTKEGDIANLNETIVTLETSKQQEIDNFQKEAEERFIKLVGKAKEEAIAEYIAEKTEELESKIDKLNAEKNRLESSVSYKSTVLENLSKKLDYLGDTEKRLSVLDGVKKSLNSLIKQLNTDSQYLLAPPTNEMIPHYEFISNELLKWGELLKRQLQQLNCINDIDVEIVND